MRRYIGILGVILGLSFVTYAHAQEMLQVKGSDTVVNLVQRLAEVYMERNPGTAIAVTGGGSGTGIAALINGRCDIANSSRLMSHREVEQALERGVRPQRVVIGMDGLTLITHARNPIKKLTIDQLGKIFRGEITNWREVGGDNVPITLYGRQPGSGSFIFFRDIVVKGDYSPKMLQMIGTAQIVEAVRRDVSGIGYVGVGYVREAPGINIIKVASHHAGAKYASPLSVEDIKSGVYPIARPLLQYVNGAPRGVARDFIMFILSPEGQRIVEEEGFFSIPEEYREFNKKSVGI